MHRVRTSHRSRSSLMQRVSLTSRMILLMLASLVGAAQPPNELTPYDVQAAYLNNFGKFIQWPPDPASSTEPISIRILGQDYFGKKLDNLIADETIQGRRIVARRLASATDSDNCHILFIGLSEEAHLREDLAALQKKPILTVSALPGFLDRGGMIQFVLQNKRVRFAVNLPAAEKTGIALSSELLKVAVYVNPASAQGDKE